MRLVEDIKSLKPIAACTVIIYPGMVMYTNTIKVKKARESVLEFLLINHPLDCPICCQGGECDLQDLSEIFGGDKGRFYESKRAVINKNFGPFIKTIMNRCIHCTRCVRYAIEISGIMNLGIIGRGSKMEISSYIEQFLKSEISGNMIDLCPVGASTSKPYSFLARSWELQNFITINIYDIFLPEIRVDSRGGEILRILPKLNLIFNEEWIADDIRYCFDASKQQRLLYPLLFLKKLILKVSWRKIFFFIKDFFINSLIWLHINKYKYFPLKLTIGSILDTQSIFLIKSFLNISGIPIRINKDDKNYNFKNQYLLSSNFIVTLEKIEYIIILGNNLRYINPLLYLKIRKLYYDKSLIIYSFGFFSNINFYIKNLGNDIFKFFMIFEGKHWISQNFLNNNIKIFISSTFLKIINLSFKNFYNFKFYFMKFLTTTYTLDINYINEEISEISLNHFGLINSIHNQNFIFMPIYMNYIIGFDNLILKLKKSIKNLIIYQGHNADYTINFSNLILPSSVFFETQDLIFIDIFYLKKKTNKVSKTPIFARTDLSILKSLIQYLGFYNEKQFNNFFKIKFKISNNKYNYSNKNNKKIKYLSYIFNFFIKSFFFNHLQRNSLFNSSSNLKKSNVFFIKLNWKNNN